MINQLLMLLAHLNAEENSMALDFVSDLNDYIVLAEKRMDKLSALEGAGVDNWCGYDLAMEMWEEDDE